MVSTSFWVEGSQLIFIFFCSSFGWFSHKDHTWSWLLGTAGVQGWLWEPGRRPLLHSWENSSPQMNPEPCPVNVYFSSLSRQSRRLRNSGQGWGGCSNSDPEAPLQLPQGSLTISEAVAHTCSPLPHDLGCSTWGVWSRGCALVPPTPIDAQLITY